MAKKASIYSAIVLIVFVGLFAGGYLLMSHRSQMQCGFCQRTINPRAHVVAEVGGKRRDHGVSVAAACARSHRTGQPSGQATALTKSSRPALPPDGKTCRKRMARVPGSQSLCAMRSRLGTLCLSQ